MTKLNTFLHDLSPVECKKFQEFVDADYFNRRWDVRRLLAYWLQSKEKPTEAECFAAVYPERHFTKKDWHLLCSRLLKLGEQFLTVEALQRDAPQQKLLLSQAYRKRQQPMAFKSTAVAAEKLLAKAALRDADYWQRRHQLADIYYDFIASQNRKRRTNLQEVSDTLDYYFITAKLKTACLAHARQTINEEHYDIHLLEAILQLVEASPELQAISSVQVYYLCYRAITEQANEQWFTKLRHVIKAQSSQFSRTEQRDIFLLATNYCIRRLNAGKTAFIREAFELYRLSLDAGFLLEDGVMPESTFSNLVTLAAKLGEYEWAEYFVEANSPLLKSVFQEPLSHYSLGLLLYHAGQLDQSMRHLAQVDTKASFLLLGTKTLQAKIYYEQQEWDALDYLLESLRVYLQRHKDLGYRKRNYEQLIYFVRKLVELPYQSKSKQQQLIEALDQAEGLTEKEWLKKMCTQALGR